MLADPRSGNKLPIFRQFGAGDGSHICLRSFQDCALLACDVILELQA